MKIYDVTLKQIEIYSIQVSANSRKEAIDKAWGFIESDEGKAEYHYDSDAEQEAIEA